jgi:hypothetical protein
LGRRVWAQLSRRKNPNKKTKNKKKRADKQKRKEKKREWEVLPRSADEWRRK